MKELYVREVWAKTDSVIPVQERFEQEKIEQICDGELLKLSLGLTSEKARAVLDKYSISELIQLPPVRLRLVLGKVQAHRLMGSFELAKRILQKGLGTRPIISRPAEALPFLASIRSANKEHFLGVFLNARNQVIHREVISVGTLSASLVHPREVFHVAIQHSAASIILAHNHPSGDVSPSPDDIALTQRIARAGGIMGIEILDHLIICRDEYLSMKEQALLT